ncbi:MAG: butyrate kinase, partial [Clostridiales bacterium]|nr:butyrate kinase [Clostridiales bacterium]
ARRYAAETGRKYTDINVIVVHMGGGVSVSAHKNGRVIDVFNAFDGDGAFSPERAGGLPSGALVKLCFESGRTEKEVKKMIVGNGGFNAYLGTNDARDVDKMCIAGDEKAILVRNAFIYQLAKNIGAMSAVLEGKVDQIILTGGIAYDKYVTAEITKKVSFIAPVKVYAGEDELLALAQGALRVMNGEEKVKEY